MCARAAQAPAPESGAAGPLGAVRREIRLPAIRRHLYVRRHNDHDILDHDVVNHDLADDELDDLHHDASPTLARA